MKKLLFILTLSLLNGQNEHMIYTNSTNVLDNNKSVEYFIRLGGLFISSGGALLAINNTIKDKNRFNPQEKQTIDTIGYCFIAIGGFIIANTRLSNKNLNPNPSP